MYNQKFGKTVNFDKFTQAVDDFFSGNHLKSVFGADAHHKTPFTNVWEDEQGLLLELAAPGLHKEDFKISLEKDLLTIATQGSVKKNAENVKVFRKEFDYQTFARSFRLNIQEFDGQKISAKYENGILALRIPRLAEKPSDSIQIQIV